VLRFVMESGAKGCEVIVSGKLRAARAKSMKFKDGYMVSSGDPVRVYLDSSVRHVLLRQGVLGIKVGARLAPPRARAGARCWGRAPPRVLLSAAAAALARLPWRAPKRSAAKSRPRPPLWKPPPRAYDLYDFIQPFQSTKLPFQTPQVRIMKDWDPTGRQGPKMPMPDVVKVHEPKEEEVFADKAKDLDL
jgi:hypothetical protein